jgi:hypothetical protein
MPLSVVWGLVARFAEGIRVGAEPVLRRRVPAGVLEARDPMPDASNTLIMLKFA